MTIIEAATKSIIAPAAPVNFDDTLSSPALFLVVVYMVKFFLSSSKDSLKVAIFIFNMAITTGSDKLTGLQLHPFGRQESRVHVSLALIVISGEAIVDVTESVSIVIVDEKIIVVVGSTEVFDKGSSVSIDMPNVEGVSVERNFDAENVVDNVWKAVVSVDIVTGPSSSDIVGPTVVSVKDVWDELVWVVVSISSVAYVVASVLEINGSLTSTIVNLTALVHRVFYEYHNNWSIL